MLEPLIIRINSCAVQIQKNTLHNGLQQQLIHERMHVQILYYQKQCVLRCKEWHVSEQQHKIYVASKLQC